ncbi:MAG: NAD-dependent deacylase [Anaerolineales bacterium]|nr:NAD-dependent deacylase [Anaerolineales bacterium]
MIPLELIATLRTATHIAVLTGAGISAESGIPTFREAQTGLWAQYEPTELATPEAFRRNPKLVWDWYAWRRTLVANATPNPSHFALAAMETHLPSFTLITQNIDSLHQRAGSRKVIELHGNLARTKCFREGVIVETWEETGETPPRCPRCGGFLRPDVVWFNEALPAEAIKTAYDKAGGAEVFFSIGTSAVVQPAASLPIIALQNGAIVVEINPTPTPLTDRMTFVLEGKAGVVLPELLQSVWGN